jgi:ceramide glucosyltransferase
VNVMTLLSLAAAFWWGLAVLLLFASVLAALLFPHLPWQGPGTEPLRPVTVIVPVKFWNDHFESDQEALFTQDYPELEIIFTAARSDPPVLAAVAEALQKFPALDSHIVQSDVSRAASPKLNSMWPGIDAAWHDLVLIKDSNIRLAAGDVENLVHHHGPGVGLVSTITIATDPENLGGWIETSIVNCYHARMLMLASALGLGAGCGKIMLFSRAALKKAGGLEGLSWAVGEDEAMQQAFAGIGLRTVLSERTSRQLLGRRSFTDIWRRQVRWMLIWRWQTPAVFVGDFLISALPVSLAAALAAHLAGILPLTAMLATLGLWFVLESLVCLCKGWPISLWSPLAFLAREILTLAVRIRALTTREIIWGDGHIRVNPKAAP